MAACANHSEANAIARCVRCRTSFCDGCIAFLVNGDPWCEPCGNGAIESGKGKPVLAAVAFVVLLAAFGALMFVQLYVIGRFFFISGALGLVPFIAAWRIAYPSTTGDRPLIVDRNAIRPRPPLPSGKRIV